MQPADFKLERYFAKYEFEVECLLSASDCESFPLEELLELADQDGEKLWRELKLGYTESKGNPLLRAEIAKLYHGISPEDLLVLAPEEGIFIALNSLLKPGLEVIATFPAYQSLLELPKALGCSVVKWDLEFNGSKWEINIDWLERNLTEKTAALLINFPHNPTGFLPSKTELDRILHLAKEHDLYVFSDEMYWLSEYDPGGRLPSVADTYEKGISLFGLSKTFGLPGLRIGWLATRDRDLLRRIAGFKDYTTICNSAPSEVLAFIALRAGELIIERNLEIIRNNIKLAGDFFEKHRDLFGWAPPKAGSVAFPELKADVPVEKFCAEVVKEKSLMILPGTVFDFPGNHFRLGLGRRNFSSGLNRLTEYLNDSGLK
ncbi:MAG: aminotransferase class I/II-fold pyridoxal phosphate-dependent enzyme [Bacillota bacterium]